MTNFTSGLTGQGEAVGTSWTDKVMKKVRGEMGLEYDSTAWFGIALLRLPREEARRPVTYIQAPSITGS